jgi:rod shape-determining protein MreC
MAWPRRSRSSISRREATRAVAGVLGGTLMVAAGLLLLVLGRAYPERQQAFRGAALDAVAPVWSVLDAPAHAVAAIVDRIDDHFGTVARNRVLEERQRHLEQELADKRRLEDENRRLRGLLEVSDAKSRHVAVARIAGGSGGSFVRSAVVSAGRAQGIEVGQPVRSAAGLIGRITEVASGASRVLLLTDPASRVPVKIRRTGQPGMAAGLNGTAIELQFLEPSQTRVRVGDELVTSGDGGIFPPDVPVAVVTDVSGETPIARPVASPNALSFVLVEEAFLPLSPSALLASAAAADARAPGPATPPPAAGIRPAGADLPAGDAAAHPGDE